MARRSRIKWNANQVSRLRKAVSSYNAAITRMEKSGNYDLLPNKTSMEREMGLIETRDELYQRERELGRILVKNRPDAQKPVSITTDNGVFIVPEYMRNEIKLAVRAINDRRREQREKLFPEGITQEERLTYLSGKNLKDLDEDYYYDGDDLDDVWSAMYPQTYKYAEQYKAVWMEYNGDPIVPEIIDWFADNEPDELAFLFESGYDEVDIHYIYSMDKSSDRTPMVIRHNNILRFWNNQYRQYTAHDFEGYQNDKY